MLKIFLYLKISGGDAVDLYCLLGGEVLWKDVRIIKSEVACSQRCRRPSREGV
jgi:hypothetical protein